MCFCIGEKKRRAACSQSLDYCDPELLCGFYFFLLKENSRDL
jgi:hypothetical protein